MAHRQERNHIARGEYGGRACERGVLRTDLRRGRGAQGARGPSGPGRCARARARGEEDVVVVVGGLCRRGSGGNGSGRGSCGGRKRGSSRRAQARHLRLARSHRLRIFVFVCPPYPSSSSHQHHLLTLTLILTLIILKHHPLKQLQIPLPLPIPILLLRKRRKPIRRHIKLRRAHTLRLQKLAQSNRKHRILDIQLRAFPLPPLPLTRLASSSARRRASPRRGARAPAPWQRRGALRRTTPRAAASGRTTRARGCSGRASCSRCEEAGVGARSTSSSSSSLYGGGGGGRRRRHQLHPRRAGTQRTHPSARCCATRRARRVGWKQGVRGLVGRMRTHWLWATWAIRTRTRMRKRSRKSRRTQATSATETKRATKRARTRRSTRTPGRRAAALKQKQPQQRAPQRPAPRGNRRSRPATTVR